MKSVLNTPLEIGVRVAILLIETYPRSVDLAHLLLLDHALLHSADLGGPSSLHPNLPLRSGEFGVKRLSLQGGLQVLLRAGLVDLIPTASGIEYLATDDAYPFVSVLNTPYALALRNRAEWATARFADLSNEDFRATLQQVFGSWVEEFENFDPESTGEASP